MSEPNTISDDNCPSLPWDTRPKTGDTFASYTLGKVLGQGSFGTVFRVQPDPEVEWYEAIKILHRSGEINKSSFIEEISQLKNIRLPGIAHIHSTGEYNSNLYYCMDYIEGDNIDQYKSQRCNDVETFYSLFFELCDTLQALHEQDVVHLDIKPQNVMVTKDNEVRLLDFGISSKAGSKIEGSGAGTYEFCPPEQIGGTAPHANMDVYALACLLYTLLSSAHPKLPFDPAKREKPYG
ncbi:MAG: serine/threonine protein kinase, partial [Lentisphaeraceae bacterium]|nr:serine/threonine protein kinase [Lentisphaeraceae bacterium]